MGAFCVWNGEICSICFRISLYFLFFKNYYRTDGGTIDWKEQMMVIILFFIKQILQNGYQKIIWSPCKKLWLCTLEIVCYRGLHLCLFQLPFFRFLLISKLWLHTACVEKLERWRKSYFWIDLNHVARFGSTKTSLDRF